MSWAMYPLSFLSNVCDVKKAFVPAASGRSTGAVISLSCRALVNWYSSPRMKNPLQRGRGAFREWLN